MKKMIIVLAMVAGLAVSAFAEEVDLSFKPFNVPEMQTIEKVLLHSFEYFKRYNAYKTVDRLGPNLYKVATWDSNEAQYIIVL